MSIFDEAQPFEKMRNYFVIVCVLFFSASVFAQSDSTNTEPKPKPESKSHSNLTVGFEIDALPYITGGYYFSAWIGIKNIQQRIRPVYSKVNMPDFMYDTDAFDRNTIVSYAIFTDYFFKPDFKSFLISTGIEYWDGEIEGKFSETAKYNNWIFTLGVGYTWKFYNNFYLNPWIAGRVRIAGDEEVNVGNYIYETPFIAPGVSLNIGWHF